ncbi:MAG TPA: hypothetical protein VFZ59_10590 [Verrucomicrobiae bacterium]|nr:hypothetical protein [Verrucomicrobiae bacterium]
MPATSSPKQRPTQFFALEKVATGLSLLVSCSLLAQPAAGRPDRNRPGPWDNDVLVYRVDKDGRPEKLATFERAGVPTLARLNDGRLISAFQHFPKDDNRNFDCVALRFSSDEGRTWTEATPIIVDGMEPGLARPFDPTLLPLPDGRVRLYFTSNRHPDFRRSTPAIYSGVSSNGIHYTFEPGVRFAIEERVVIDCAVVLHDGIFHLFVPDNGTAKDFMAGQQQHEPPPGGSGYHATSSDGLKFTRVDDVKIPDHHQWLGNAVSDGKQITFFGTAGHGQRKSGQPRGGVWTSTSTNGSDWPSANLIDVPGADPGAVAHRDGGWIVVVTGPPRRGMATQQQRQQPRPPFQDVEQFP